MPRMSKKRKQEWALFLNERIMQGRKKTLLHKNVQMHINGECNDGD